MELHELIPYMFNMECKLFMKMDSYRLIEQKCNKKCLNPDERQLLNSEIYYVFKLLIKMIIEPCPELTDEDVVFCCLAKSGLDNRMISRCLGSNSMQAIIQRKYRIKKKMWKAKCENLFEVIFEG